jgi:hypothetical protein
MTLEDDPLDTRDAFLGDHLRLPAAGQSFEGVLDSRDGLREVFRATIPGPSSANETLALDLEVSVAADLLKTAMPARALSTRCSPSSVSTCKRVRRAAVSACLYSAIFSLSISLNTSLGRRCLECFWSFFKELLRVYTLLVAGG